MNARHSARARPGVATSSHREVGNNSKVNWIKLNMENSGVKSMLLADSLLSFCLKRHLNKPPWRYNYVWYCKVHMSSFSKDQDRDEPWKRKKKKKNAFFSAASMFIIFIYHEKENNIKVYGGNRTERVEGLSI